MAKRFNHAFTIAFEVQSDEVRPTRVPVADLRAGMFEAVSRMDGEGEFSWRDAVSHVDVMDTREGED